MDEVQTDLNRTVSRIQGVLTCATDKIVMKSIICNISYSELHSNQSELSVLMIGCIHMA